MNDERLKERQVQHLLLLVGRNPLPNAVAGSLLLQPGRRITLIHSKRTAHSPGTGGYAKSLGVWLKSPLRGVTDVELIEIEDSDPTSIFSGVQDALNKLPDAASVGLNYTGGTKAMSVHAYRALEQWAQKKAQAGRKLQTVFSYLDARTLRMIFDPAHPENGEQAQGEYVGLLVELKLEEMMRLHGWTLNPKCPPFRQSMLPKTAETLAKAYADKRASWKWVEWKDGKLKRHCQIKRRWKKDADLKTLTVPWPQDHELSNVVATLKRELNQQTGDLDIGAAARTCGTNPEYFCEWLDGKWLEHAVLNVLEELSGSFKLHQHVVSVHPQEVDFDVDVIGIRGYQLFAFSCSLDTDEQENPGGRDRLKKKLFEAFVRARQLGGDEARLALVCCSRDPDNLAREVRRDIDPEGRIHVFGRGQLRHLEKEISTWMQAQMGKE